MIIVRRATVQRDRGVRSLSRMLYFEELLKNIIFAAALAGRDGR